MSRFTFVVEHIYHVEAESLVAAREAFSQRSVDSFDFEDVTAVEDEMGEEIDAAS